MKNMISLRFEKCSLIGDLILRANRKHSAASLAKVSLAAGPLLVEVVSEF
jgi:hypothetical protein